MKIVVRILGAVVLVVLIAIGGVAFNSGSGTTTSDPAVISDYRADFTVDADGLLQVQERLTVFFPVARHGIFRFFDTRDPNNSKNQLTPTDISVSRDGRSEPYEILHESRGRYLNVKIGDANQTLTGEHLYVIGYRIKGALSTGIGGARTEFFWNLIPGGWRNAITNAELTVHLPAVPDPVACAVGAGASSGCELLGKGTRTLEVRASQLPPNTPVTLRAGLDIATPAGNTLPWDNALNPVLGTHPAIVLLILVLAGLAGLGGALLSRSTKETPPGFPLMYAPPEGIGPAQAAYLLKEDVDSKAFVASLMYAAEGGACQMSLENGAWTVTAKDPQAWATLDEVTQRVGNSLGITAQGAAFTADPHSVSAGQNLKSALSSFDDGTEGWAKLSGLMVNSGLGVFGGVVILVAAGLSVWLGAFNPFGISILALIPGVFAIAAVSVAFTGAGTRRTPAGRDLWSRVGGFHRILSTESAEARFDFSGHKELYTAYLPWAVAFGCADVWAHKYQLATNEPPPMPPYFLGYGLLYGGGINDMVDSFDSSVSSAISSYEATQRSSSSGGGGFGGGGGGGGGGGSW